ncbi:MAG: substrate-binding domain-containing protein [Pseudomonadota bacterium]
MLKLFLTSALAAVAVPVIAAHASSLAASKPIEIVGTGDGMALVRALGRQFNEDHSGPRIVVPPSIGSGGGIAAVGAGKAFLARVARPLKREEQAMGLKIRPLFRLPTAIYAHPDVALDELSFEQLVDIFIGKTTNWSDLGGPDLRIRVVRREDTDSSLSVLRASMPGWSDLLFTSRAKTAVTTQDAVETVKANRGAIGFGPYSRQLDETTQVMKINGRHPTDSAYLSAVTVSFVWHEARVTEVMRQFVQFAYSEVAQGLLREQGAVPAVPSSTELGN